MLSFHPSGRYLGAPTSKGTARVWDLRDGGSRLLRGHRGEVNTLRFTGSLVATSSDDGTVRLWELKTGRPRWRATGGARTTPAEDVPSKKDGHTARARVGQWLAVGYEDGNVELVSRPSGQRRTGFILEDAAASAVTRLVAGPRGTLLAGYANGLVVVWDSKTGKLLDRRRLHGPVTQLQLRDQRLHVASELGDRLTWDLSAFYLDYCRLLRQVWRRVPVAWEGGLPEVRLAPEKHRCAQR
jgi:WD40 repeat protein